MNKLNPCPICGKKVEIIEGYYDRPFYWIGCKNCRTEFMAHELDDISMTKQDCIDDWNNGKLPPFKEDAE